MRTFPAVRELLPHEAPMIVIDRVADADENRVESITTVTADHPLFEASQDSLPGWALIELMAQTVALYSGLKAHAQQQPVRIGYLLGTRKLELHRQHFRCDETLRVRAQCEFLDPEGLGSFACQVLDENNHCVAEATVNVYQDKGEVPE